MERSGSDDPRCPECYEFIEPELVGRAEVGREHAGVHLLCPNCAEHLILTGNIGEPTVRRPPHGPSVPERRRLRVRSSS